MTQQPFRNNYIFVFFGEKEEKYAFILFNQATYNVEAEQNDTKVKKKSKFKKKGVKKREF